MPAKKLKLPGDGDARRLVKLFRQAEREIAARLAQLLSETDDKKKRSIRAIEQEQKAVKKILKELLESSEKEAQLLVDHAFNGGLAVAKQELEAAGISEIVVEMGGVNSRALKVYSEQIYNRLAEVVQQASRTTTDIYQALKVDSAMAGAVGGYDALGTVRRNMQKISAERGISAIIDKKGRSWTMATYCEMLTRTATAEIFHQAKTNEYLAHGEDLVLVTYHTPTCEKCSPWGGKVLSLTGETQGYPTMAEAKAAGLFHPNCRHTYSLYLKFEDGTDNGPFRLTDDETAAVKRYVSSDSYKINERLRSRSPLTQDEQQFVDELDHALDKLPDYNGTVFRNISFDMVDDEEFEKFILRHAIGGKVTYRAYTSASKSTDGYPIDGDKIVSYTIKVKHGKDINHFGFGIPEEQEVLLKRRTRFKILEAARDGNMIFLTMEEL